MENRICLTLPVPPCPCCVLPDYTSLKSQDVHVAYHEKVWALAVEQVEPWLAPPPLVHVAATFYTRAVWDECRRSSGLGYVLRALEPRTYRSVLHPDRYPRPSYFVSRMPAHMKIVGVPDAILVDDNPRVEIIIGWEWDPERAA